MKNIAILGSTGSIGTQALDVIRANPELYKVSALTANANAELLIQQALEFKPGLVVIGDENQFSAVKNALSGKGIKVLAGEDALCEAAASPEVHLVLTAIMGSVGLRPTIAAIKAKKTIAWPIKKPLL